MQPRAVVFIYPLAVHQGGHAPTLPKGERPRLPSGSSIANTVWDCCSHVDPQHGRARVSKWSFISNKSAACEPAPRLLKLHSQCGRQRMSLAPGA